jgi:hypothetical protein
LAVALRDCAVADRSWAVGLRLDAEAVGLREPGVPGAVLEDFLRGRLDFFFALALAAGLAGAGVAATAAVSAAALREEVPASKKARIDETPIRANLADFFNEPSQ